MPTLYPLLSLDGPLVANLDKGSPLEFRANPLADERPACFVTAEDGQSLIDAEPEKFAWLAPLPPAEVQALASTKTLALVEALAAASKVKLKEPKVSLGALPAEAPKAEAEAVEG